MVDIQSVTAEIREGIKKKKETTRKNIMSASATQGGHKNCFVISKMLLYSRFCPCHLEENLLRCYWIKSKHWWTEFKCLMESCSDCCFTSIFTCRVSCNIYLIVLIMVALWNRADHYIFAPWFLLSFFFLSSYFLFSSPNLSGPRLDVCHTSTHGEALVRI